jgi:transposase, IS30 family
MSKLVRGNQRHMSLDDRIYIQQALEKGLSFKDIAKFLCKDPTTISKEVKKHRLFKQRNTFAATHSGCKNRATCTLTNVCNRPIPCGKKRCANCSQCKLRCKQFIKDECPKIKRAPHVCNGCETKMQCRFDKYFYKAVAAQDHYKSLLSASRDGINISEAALYDLDALVEPLILRGQSIAHIYAKHAEDIPCSSRTLYNYIANNLLSVKNIDLPRKVRYKPRKKHKKPIRDAIWLEGRKYSDFTKYLEENSDTSVVEMDTVEGVKGGKVLLTMLFRNSRLMIAFLLPDKTQKSVLKIFQHLEEELGTLLFKMTFPLILTDNGSEFLNPIMLENGIDTTIRTNIFYCDPNRSCQKGALEKNHEFIRYIYPKGSTFDNCTQKDITLMINHINSTARACLNSQTPFELASLLLDQFVIKTLALKKIEHDMVTLKPMLIKNS